MKKILIIALAAIALGVILMAATSVTSTRLVSKLTVSEKLTTSSIAQVVRHAELDRIINFRPTSDTVTTDVDNAYSAELTGTGTIDLTSISNSLGDALDLTGERIVALKIKNSSTTGTDEVNVTEGASNPYPLMGSTYSLNLKPKQDLLFSADTALTDVDASNKDIDYTCNGDTLSILLISANLY